MSIPYKMRLLPLVLAGVMAGSLAWADDEVPTTDTADTEVVETVSDVPTGKIAGFFSDFLGSDADAEATVQGLRDGSIHYQAPEDDTADTTGDATDTTGDTADTTDQGDATTETDGGDMADVEGEVSDGSTGMGNGNVVITLALAQKLAEDSAAKALEGETGMTAEESINQVLYLRQEEGMGWGQIAHELGFNLGELMSGIHSNRPERAETAKAKHQADRAERSMPEHAHKMDKADRPEQMAKAQRPEKMERAERPEKMERPERPEKIERPEKPERPERPGH
ncbi:hypothetical protein [Microbulbifer sp. SAOS-129_SWC]|uniref:hypothetical protein n=1 Tax=Microbulbifer sp. SAOS-129_SWC TaxID=3145235 RepID=UPI003216D0CE